MKCPKCETQAVRANAGFRFDGPEYWWCKTCKDEVAPPKIDPKDTAKEAQDNLEEIWRLTSMGFSVQEAEEWIKASQKKKKDSNMWLEHYEELYKNLIKYYTEERIIKVPSKDTDKEVEELDQFAPYRYFGF